MRVTIIAAATLLRHLRHTTLLRQICLLLLRGLALCDTWRYWRVRDSGGGYDMATCCYYTLCAIVDSAPPVYCV